MLFAKLPKSVAFLFAVVTVLGSAFVVQAADDASLVKLRVLSYNIQIGRAPGGSYGDPAAAHLDRTADAIRKTDPDVAGLQEVDNKTERSGADVDQLGELSQLTGLVGSFAAKTKLPGGDYGIGVLSKERPLETRVVLLEGSSHTRALQIIEFERFVFFNTHLPLTAEKRLAAVAKIEEEAKKYDKPILLVGDLNAEPDSEEIKKLEENWKNIGADDATFPAPAPEVRIDYVFIRNVKNFNVVKTEVIRDEGASDHRPVFCEVEFE